MKWKPTRVKLTTQFAARGAAFSLCPARAIPRLGRSAMRQERRLLHLAMSVAVRESGEGHKPGTSRMGPGRRDRWKGDPGAVGKDQGTGSTG